MDNLFSLERLTEATPLVLQYLPVTLEMVVFSEVLGVCLALVIALVKIKRVPVLSHLFTVYISFMRGTPIIVQMLVVIYGLPMLVNALLGINISRLDVLVFVIIALALNEGAFVGEIFRTSVQAVNHNQFEAGLSCGLTWFQTFRRIVLPQAVRIAIPPYGANLVGLLHSSSMAYLVGALDLMGGAQSYATINDHSLEAFTVVLVVYVAISLLVRAFFSVVDTRLARAY